MSTPLTILHGGHRKVVRIGANDSMSNVLQIACREFGLNAGSSFILKHKRNVVDLSQPFRFTGIPQNATLELEEGSAPRKGGGSGGAGSGGAQVRVAMRLTGDGGGRRVQGSFSPEISLAGLLKWWAERGELDAGVLERAPSLQFMRRAYKGDDLESTTLRSIGLLTGSGGFPSATGPASDGAGAPGPASIVAAATSSEVSAAAQAQEEADIARAIALSVAEYRVPQPQTGDTDVDGSAAIANSPKPRGQAATPPSPPDTGNAASEAPIPEAHPPAAATRQEDGAMEGVTAGGGKGGEAGGPADEEAASGGRASTMEMDPPSASSQPQAPTMGIAVCREALQAMASNHFDADSTACVITLAKIIDNIVHKPGDTRTRQLRRSNAAFHQKVGRIQGGVEFLQGVGFVPQDEEMPPPLLGGGAALKNSSDGSTLVLPTARENDDLLKKARSLLSEQAVVFGVPQERMPQPPRSAPKSSSANTSQGVTFDPYKPFMTSTAPTPKGPAEQSQTEKRLQELLAKRADVVGGGVPERDIQVSLPSQAASSSTSGGGLADMEGVTTEEVGGDRGLIVKKVAQQMAERKKREDAPFQTKAMREIERLQKTTVYRTTVIKVQFPDRVVVQATFASTEGVRDLVAVVRDCLGQSHRNREFTLYVSPPRKVLKETSSLSEAGLVPAALVYVSWKNVPPAGEDEGAYLDETLVGKGGNITIPVARPVGVALAGGASAGEPNVGSGGARGRGVGNPVRAAGRSRPGSSGGKGKPSWLKLN